MLGIGAALAQEQVHVANLEGDSVICGSSAHGEAVGETPGI